MSLFHKFFVSFLMICLLVLVLVIGTARFFIYRNFSEYVARAELSKLDHLAAALVKEYSAQGGWDRIEADPRRWHQTLRRVLPLDHDLQNADGRPRFARPPGGRNASKLGPAPPLRGTGRPRDPMQLGDRLLLLDAESRLIAGTPDPREHRVTRDITLNGELIGKLGLTVPDNFYHPLDINYLKGQNQALYIIGAAILLLVSVVAYFLTRHLAEPVRKLSEGTRALASFHFNTKIEVDSRDEIGALADDFNRMAATLEKYETLRQQWIVDISHELRTPIAILRAEIEALQDGVRELNRAALDSIHAEILRLAQLVEDLHQLSLADSRNLVMKTDPVDPLSILTDILGAFRNRFADGGIQLDPLFADEPPATISGDPDQLVRLFSNLLENTLKYTDSPGLLRISAARSDSRMILLFEDSEPGVPESDLHRIFERLYRVDKSRSRQLGGSGLGLGICRQIVEHHGGTVTASPSPLGGLTIRIEFPIIS